MPKRIGFVDYKLENYHANVFLKAYRGPLQARGWTVAGCWALDADNGRAWAAHNDVPWFESAERLNEHIDAYMVLAPSNPELHLRLCESVFPFGKTTYVDKTFAPDLATIAPYGFPPEFPVRTGTDVWGYAAVVVLVLALAIGLPPALHAMRLKIVDALAGR